MSLDDQPTFEAMTASELEGEPSFWSLYETAFPAEERDPRAVIMEGIARGVVDVVRARSGATALGFAVLHRLRQPAVGFLVYLAVIPEARGRRIGEALFREVERRSPGGVVWEIDVPALAPHAAERSVRDRRQRFFGRLGGVVVSTDYLQPPINGPQPVPMLLMATSAAKEHSVDELVDAVYRDKYIGLNGVDAEVVRALRSRDR